MQGTHDLERAPGLVDAQVGDDVWPLDLDLVLRERVTDRERVGEDALEEAGRPREGEVADRLPGRRDGRALGQAERLRDVGDGEAPRVFRRDRRREAVPELERIGGNDLARVAGVARPDCEV